MSESSIQLGANADRLLEWIRRYAREVKGKDMETPLPTTRALGDRFSVSNSTASRMLELAENEGMLWRKPNGRFYPIRARSLVERPKPLACLFRSLEDWSAMYRELMEGICAACGKSGTAVMLWPDVSLVKHADPAFPPQIAGPRKQRAALDLFLRRYGDTVGGIIWDHDWDDAVIEEFADRLPPSVMACRQTRLPSVGHVGVDYSGVAVEALGYLLGQGYETIHLVEPFAGEPAVDQMIEAFQEGMKRLALKKTSLLKVHSPDQRTKVLQQLSRERKRTALICPEDNIASELADGLVQMDASFRSVGLLATQGSSVAARANLTRLECDYRRIGECCIGMLEDSSLDKVALSTRVIPGESTG